MAAQVDPERYRRELLVFLWRNTNYLWAERDKPLKSRPAEPVPPGIQKQSLEKEHRPVLFFAPENLLCLTISKIYLTL